MEQTKRKQEMKAQELLDELEKEQEERENRKRIFNKINPETLKRYSVMGIEICVD